MPVYLVALVEAALYLGAVPVFGVFTLDGRSGLRFGIGAFEKRFALRRSQRARRPRRGKAGLSPWRVARRLRGAAISLRGRLGLGDAAATALACGLLRSLGMSLGVLARRAEVAVTPVFDGEAPVVELRGMIRARAGQIMIAAARCGIDSVKGRLAQWTDTRLKAS